ncbi:MAG: hypothetical protein SVX43_02660, partial [Cyanobacteriota bacterium]|nr:hypothetical protein [Cyanobacteriota bacterium]
LAKVCLRNWRIDLGNGEWGMGNGEWGMGTPKRQEVSQCLIPFFFILERDSGEWLPNSRQKNREASW